MTDHPEGLRCFCDHKNRQRAARPRDEWTEVRVQSRPSEGLVENARRAAAAHGRDPDQAAAWVEFVFDRGAYTRQLCCPCDDCGDKVPLTVDQIQMLADWAAAKGVPYLLLRHVRRVLRLIGKEPPGNMAQ